MTINVFAKKRTTKDGSKSFYTYITKLVKKDGSTITASVKFPEDNTPKADEFPLTITFDKADANMSSKAIENEETGEVIGESHNLWLKKYTKSEYIDTSLDDFE